MRVNQNMEFEKDTLITSIFRKIGRGLKAYLCDWRNLLGHGLIGVVFLVVAIWAPINIWIKVAIIVCLICFNIIRMRRKSRKKKVEAFES